MWRHRPRRGVQTLAQLGNSAIQGLTRALRVQRAVIAPPLELRPVLRVRRAILAPLHPLCASDVPRAHTRCFLPRLASLVRLVPLEIPPGRPLRPLAALPPASRATSVYLEPRRAQRAPQVAIRAQPGHPAVPAAALASTRAPPARRPRPVAPSVRSASTRGRPGSRAASRALRGSFTAARH